MKKELSRLYQKVSNFSLDDRYSQFCFTDRLARENGWSKSFAQRVVAEYKRFMFLAVASGHPVTPSEQVDQVWHLHMIYTESYWNEFCRDILGKPIHHGPTKGGTMERAKYHDWYEKTKQSYQRLFGTEPPVDIWPPSAKRFGSDLRVQRVNVAKNWVVPKLPVRWSAILIGILVPCWLIWKTGVIGGVILAASVLPSFLGTGESNSSNSSLAWGAGTALVIAGILNLVLRWFLRSPKFGDEVRQRIIEDERDFHPYDIAYLKHGDSGTIDAVVVQLLNREIIVFDEEQRCLTRNDQEAANEQVREPLHDLEVAVLERVDSFDGAPLRALHKKYPALDAIADRVNQHGLIVSEKRSWLGRVVPITTLFVAGFWGLMHVSPLVGLDNAELAGMYVLVVPMLVGITAAIFCPLFRTRRGDRMLQKLQRYHGLTRQRVSDSPEKRQANDLVLAFILFGPVVLEVAGLPHLRTLFLPPDPGPASSSSCGGGCGGGSDDGGDGGCDGGCGGCGCGGCG